MVFEFQLGYSGKAMASGEEGREGKRVRAFRQGLDAYAVNKVPESYARFLASRLLREEKAQEGSGRLDAG